MVTVTSRGDAACPSSDTHERRRSQKPMNELRSGGFRFQHHA